MHPMLNTAVKAARRAGNIITRASRNLDLIKVETKSANDFVSEVDREAERAIIDVLLKAYPKHSILAEESGASGAPGGAEYQWIIDPLDGTTNFLHGFPQYSISIALAHKDVLTQAVVYDPNRNDLYTATRGTGAYLNDQRIRVTKRTNFQECLIGTGFPFRMLTHLEAYIAMFRDIASKTAGLRRPGSAALDLAWLAAGRIDGFWEIGLGPWDMAAGALLITEAGGLVGDLRGESGYLKKGNIVAGNPKVFAQMIRIIEPHITAALAG